MQVKGQVFESRVEGSELTYLSNQQLTVTPQYPEKILLVA